MHSDVREVSADDLGILLVDDEADILQFYRTAIEVCDGIRVTGAATAEEALTHALRQTFGLVLLDINMPGASGLEILPVLRNACPHAIIAIVSGHVPRERSQDALDCADTVIIKPIAMGRLLELVESARQLSAILHKVRSLTDTVVSPREEDEVDEDGDALPPGEADSHEAR